MKALPTDPLELARAGCELLKERTDEEFTYLGTYQFGTPGGHDVDLRVLCVGAPSPKKHHEILAAFEGIDQLDLLYITPAELEEGRVTDLTEAGRVEDHLQHGFNPHHGQPATGDTSLFSLYIFATLRPFHELPD